MKSINFGLPFEDDSLTYSDGPLERFFRMRKWMFLVGAVLLVLRSHWIDYPGMVRLIGFPTLPESMVRSGITVLGVYLVVQSTFVLRQVSATYDQVVQAKSETFKILQAGRSLDQLKQVDLVCRELQNQLDAHRANRASYKPEAFAEREATLTAPLAEGARIKDQLQLHATFQGSDQERRRRAIMWTERVLDGIRIFPSYGLLIFALITSGDLRFDQTPPVQHAISPSASSSQ